MIGMFKQRNNQAMTHAEMVDFVNPYFKSMRKPGNKFYKGRVESSIQGCLNYNGLFFKDCQGYWRMKVSIGISQDMLLGRQMF